MPKSKTQKGRAIQGGSKYQGSKAGGWVMGDGYVQSCREVGSYELLNAQINSSGVSQG